MPVRVRRQPHAADAVDVPESHRFHPSSLESSDMKIRPVLQPSPQTPVVDGLAFILAWSYDRLDQDAVLKKLRSRISKLIEAGTCERAYFGKSRYTSASLHAEALAEADPAAHADQVKAGYIDGMPEQAPSVITLNMRASSACVMEFIARAYPFRQQSNRGFARTRFMLAEAFEEHEAESACAAGSTPLLGAGAAEPLLGLPVLGPQEHE